MVSPPLTMKPGTILTVSIIEPVSSDRNRVGDVFSATLTQPVIVLGIVVARYGQSVGLTPERIAKARGFLARYGPVGVFGARFVTGLRFLAGPLAGSGGLRPLPFCVANILGALVYVPLTVGEGYAAAYGLGDYVIRIHRGIVNIEQVLLRGALLGLFLLLGWRLRHHWQARYKLAQNVSRLDPDAT